MREIVDLFVNKAHIYYGHTLVCSSVINQRRRKENKKSTHHQSFPSYSVTNIHIWHFLSWHRQIKRTIHVENVVLSDVRVDTQDIQTSSHHSMSIRTFSRQLNKCTQMFKWLRLQKVTDCFLLGHQINTLTSNVKQL